MDENGQPVVKGTKVSRGYYADNGPQTTLSGTGKDVSLSYQGFAAVDNVQFVNGNQLGTRLLFQVSRCVWGGVGGGWGLVCEGGRVTFGLSPMSHRKPHQHARASVCGEGGRVCVLKCSMLAFSCGVVVVVMVVAAGNLRMSMCTVADDKKATQRRNSEQPKGCVI